MKILVLGTTGLLGHKLFQIAKEEGHDAFGICRTESHDSAVFGNILADDTAKINKILEEISPEVVVNCIGITKQLCKDSNIEEVIKINSLFPHELFSLCSKNNIRFIHISTDCVFSGSKGNYSEEDIPDPQDIYGRSKLLGEVNGKNALTIRTSFIGRELKNPKHGLLDWFLQQDKAEGFANVKWSGFTNIELSRIILKLAESDIEGLLHVGGDSISKYDLLLIIRDTFNLNTIINKVELPFCDRSLNSKKFRELNIPYKSLKEMISELKEDYN